MSARLAAAWLDDRTALEEAELAALLAACQDDPAQTAQLKEQLLVAEACAELFDPTRADFANRVRKAVAMRGSQRVFTGRVAATVRRRRRARRLRHGGLAAAALVLCTLGAVLWWSAQQQLAPPPMRPVADQMTHVVLQIEAGEVRDGAGRLLSDGAAIANGLSLTSSAESRARLHLGSGIVIAVDGGSRLACSGGPEQGWRCQLMQGGVAVAYQPGSARGLQVQTRHAQVHVTGTRFRVRAGATGSEVAVEEGSVRILDDSGRWSTLRDGQQQRFGSSAMALVDLQTIDELADPAWRIWHGSGDTACRSQRDADGVRTITFAHHFSWLSWARRRGIDCTASDGLRCTWRGRGDGASYRCEIIDASAGVERGERFVFAFVDDQTGWRELRFPWSGFVRRDWQADQPAPDDGLQLQAITMVAFWRESEGGAEVALRDLATYRHGGERP